jgi:hypothetical protein
MQSTDYNILIPGSSAMEKRRERSVTIYVKEQNVARNWAKGHNGEHLQCHVVKDNS